MSMPQFPDIPDGFTFDKSIYQILTSIAMEELGLSHVLNAEGEKIQYVLGTLEGVKNKPHPTIDQVLEVNESVNDMLQQVAINQMFLIAKMSEALKAYLLFKKNGYKEEPPAPPEPPAPVDPPDERVPATAVRIRGEDEVEFTLGTRYGPGCVITPTDSTDVPVWTSNAPEIVSVAQDGMMYLLKVGTAVITVTVGDVSAAVKINVLPRPPATTQ
jgi:hypothetical protein